MNIEFRQVKEHYLDLEANPIPPDFKVARVETLTQLKEFITIQAHINGLPPDAAEV